MTPKGVECSLALLIAHEQKTRSHWAALPAAARDRAPRSRQNVVWGGIVQTVADDAEHYRKQAAKCREQAAMLGGDTSASNVWLRLATEYDELAVKAETMNGTPAK